jgi:hypothetical protein
VRRLLQHCGLEFEPECLRLQPIARDGLHHWKNFAPWLGPLETALRPVLLD